MRDIIDLHTHSLITDGSYSPRDVVKNAYNNNVKVLALTDHDSIGGISEAIEEANKFGIKIINGIEISALYKDGNMIHILGYGMNIYDKVFLKAYEKMRKAREATMENVLNILKEKYNLDIDIDVLREKKLDSFISRHDIHKYIIDNNISNNSKYIWNTYLDPIPYEKNELIPIDEAISTIVNSGGLAFLAHYNNKTTGLGKYNKNEIENHIEYLKSLGLSGVERYYPTFTEEDEEFLDYITSKYNLLSSGGTDYHGEYRKNNDIGIGDGSFYVEFDKIKFIKDNIFM
ncbi:PHP domain-containing protein [Clostridium sp. NSJ-6]|uniref:PHP domain-containing protein n=1 Tax=Clostridium hominis TaxID=2763036 RepID=A0ABR7DEX8_9CLOT|nr:PHP domain-containing protein [Clostridium hominis]MBC5629198.1 PHP domain-containing protein [Clostridium hominis]SCI90093.1 Histidinol phosphatase and related hydrolases of the PHP family [uncultured Clostridium sp.]